MTRLRDVIRDQIRSDVLPPAQPGQRLPGIREISESYGGSVSTIVAAYRALAEEGLVEPRHGSGYYKTRSPADGAAPEQDLGGVVHRGRALLAELAACLDQVEAYHRKHRAGAVMGSA